MGPIGWGALAAGNLIGSLIGSSQQRKQRQQEGIMRAAELESSPWTGKEAQTQVSTPQANPWLSMIGAGTNVLSQGQALEKSMREADAEKRKSMWNDIFLNKLASQQNLKPEQLYALSNM